MSHPGRKMEPSDGPAYYAPPAEEYNSPDGVRELTDWGEGSLQSGFPYRGFEQHGVPDRPEPQFIPHDVATFGNAVVPAYKETLGNPVPVVVVQYPDPVGVQNTFQTASYTFLGLEQPIRIVARRPERNRLLLRTTVGEVFIAPNSHHAMSGLGFSVNVAAGSIALFENDEVWAYATAAATITLLEEFTVTQGGALG